MRDVFSEIKGLFTLSRQGNIPYEEHFLENPVVACFECWYIT